MSLIEYITFCKCSFKAIQRMKVVVIFIPSYLHSVCKHIQLLNPRRYVMRLESQTKEQQSPQTWRTIHGYLSWVIPLGQQIGSQSPWAGPLCTVVFCAELIINHSWRQTGFRIWARLWVENSQFGDHPPTHTHSLSRAELCHNSIRFVQLPGYTVILKSNL